MATTDDEATGVSLARAAPASPARAAPYLPTTVPQPPSRTGRLFAVWVAAFTAIYTAIVAGVGGAAIGATVVGGLVLYVGGATALVMRRLRRFNPENNAAMVALGRGDRDRAAALFERWVPRGGPLARHNLAWTRTLQGRPREAIELLIENEASRRLRSHPLHATSALDLAFDHALIGELDAASAWLDEAGRRKAVLVTHDSMKALAAAVIGCRRGRDAEVARDLEQHWLDYEAVAARGVLRPLAIVRAFATAAAGPREAGQIHGLLTRPGFPGEYDFLAVEWPEMATFLAAHRLAEP